MAASQPGRGLAARQLVGGVAVATLLPILNGCQTGMGVSVLNDCRESVETRVTDVHDEWSVSWHRIAVGGRDGVVATPKDTELLYVQTRINGDNSPTQFTVAVADLPKPPKGDDDVEIVLRGDRCPGAAG